MAKALLSMVLEQLGGSFIPEEIKNHVGLAVGIEEEIHKLTSNFEAIQAVLEDAERKQVKEASVRNWLCKLKDVSYDVEDVLDEWNTAKLKSRLAKEERAAEDAHLLKKLRYSISLSSSQIILQHNIAQKIKELNGRLDFIAAEKDRYKFELGRTAHDQEPEQQQITTSFIDVTDVYGRDEDKNAVLNMLLEEKGDEESLFQIISIVGMGGIGKTTLARLAYNENVVNTHFEKKIWVCVSDPFDDIKIAKAILESLGDVPNVLELQALLQRIRKSIAGKKFLLVLDDVWNEDDSKWEPFKESLSCGSLGSKILMTTRKENVAAAMGSTTLFPLGKLAKEESWLLFSRIAFSGRTSRECQIFEDFGRKIADKCQGLPLALKTLGGLMRFKRTIEQWRSVLNSEIWELKEAERGIFPPLLLSYYDLSPALRQCFSYCAIFPKDYVIEKDRLISLWMAQGFLKKGSKNMEILGREYFEDLAMCSFFQDFERDDDGNITKCKMHDIVHDFAQFLSKNECFMVEVNGFRQPKVDTSDGKGRHLMLVLGEKVEFPTYTCNVEKLRSLLVEPSNYYACIVNDSLPKLFNQVTCLRALDLTAKYCTTMFGSSVTEVPKEIAQLIHLRYLNLSNNDDFEELPEALCELYNLQTLDLTFCKRLRRLPSGIGKLVNLRHLKNYGTWRVRFMPKGMEKLTCLRTLREFSVSEGGTCESSSIGELGSLIYLQDYLEIRGLGNVRDVNEAKKAKLQTKQCLLNLLLKFDMDEKKAAEGGITNGDALVLEALQPPPYLECLEIHNYRGPCTLPKWMFALTNLRYLAVCSCRNWERLPPFGKLPSLESLWIYDTRRVKKMGVEFLGLERDEEHPFSCSSFIPFPKLKRLEMHDMNELEEWEYGVVPFLGNRKERVIMPCLSYLVIDRCPRLKALPHHLHNSSIETLEIRWCPILAKVCSNISSIPNIRVNYMEVKRDRV